MDAKKLSKIVAVIFLILIIGGGLIAVLVPIINNINGMRF